ncbi:hypothetical protein [Nitrolancea hollandica]|uniref:Uncharacterized protein n=1 Tax=Nitrolancea hollandica Lb TaxID=1129897 RepID=I4EF16_9BACT|nr:hypothetical protein [Nitrolancea hollandica]CCF83278.1 hypothetical protein NITHO_2170006 [Nitrolancea hollandica Lb]
MDEQQPKADSVTVMDVAPAETGETTPHTFNPANPFGLLTRQFVVAAEAAWTNEQRRAIQQELCTKAQVMRERLDTFLDQLRADRACRYDDEAERD